MNRETVLMRMLVVLGIASLLFLAGCGSAASTAYPSGSNPTPNPTPAPNPTPNSVPTISSLSPSCSPEGQQALNPFVNGQLLVNGQNFVGSSVVRWNSNDRPTTFYSNSQLNAQISASDIAAAGTAAVTVFNPAPGGGSSNTSTFTITTGGVGPQSIAVDPTPTGKFAYVANRGCGDSAFGNVSMYTINPTTGALATIEPPVASHDEGGRAVTVDPSGKFAYVANWGEGDTAGSVSAYTINATTRALTSTETIYGGSAGLCAPWSVVVDPSGKFAYVANEGCPAPTNVSMFTINTTTGALTFIGTIAAGGRAISVVVDPKGKFAYVASRSNPPGSAGNVSMYAINTATGALTSIGTIAAGTDPISVAVDPTGKFAYVTNSGSNDVSMYTINTATGDLTSIGTTTGGSGAIAIHPSGKFVYVSNSAGSVSVYTINAATGTLTSIGTTGTAGSSIAIHPSGAFAYVTNAGSNDVSMYSIDAATGTLTLIGTIGT
jgi:DNA-binding beta-propeller fold protein YncE